MKILDIEPSDNYDLLKRQFHSLKQICYCLEEQLRYYQKQERIEYSARNQLDSEKEANAILTAEVEKLQRLLEIKK